VTGLSCGDEAQVSADWSRLLQEHRVQYVLLSVDGDDGLLRLLRSCGGWEMRWEVGGTVLLARATSRGDNGGHEWVGDYR
jgi:hypothetical protein